MTVRVIHAQPKPEAEYMLHPAPCITCGRPDTAVSETPYGKAHICGRCFADTWPHYATGKQKRMPVYYDMEYLRGQAVIEDRCRTMEADEEIYRHGEQTRRDDHADAANRGH